MSESKIVSERLNEYLGILDITVAELSRMTGIEYTVLYSYVRGSASPSSRNLARLATATGFSADWWLGIR